MTDKVQKIKEWISKEQDGLMDAQGNFEYPEHEGAYHILCNLDAYIDSLQEEPEPQFKVGDTIHSKVWERAVHEIVYMDDSAYFFENGGMVKFDGQEQWELAEEPVNEDLDDAAYNYVMNNYGNPKESSFLFEQRCFKAGAEWGKNQAKVEIQTQSMALAHRCPKKPVSEDSKKEPPKVWDRDTLDEYAYQVAYDLSNDWMRETPTWDDVEIAVKLGAKWQKEKLWKPADDDDLPRIDKEVIVLTQKYPLKGSEYAVSFAHRPYKGKYIGKSLTTGNIETFENETYGKGGWNIPDVKWWLDCEWPNKEE